MKKRIVFPAIGIGVLVTLGAGLLLPSAPIKVIGSAAQASDGVGDPPAAAPAPSDQFPLPEVGAPPLQVNASQLRINGPCYFVEISQGRFIKDDNPRGWAHPFYNELPQKGWSILLGDMLKASQSGYTSVWLWEPTGQYAVDRGGCMAWFSRKTLEDSWSPKMKESFPVFVKTVRERLKMEIIFYSGCANYINVGSTIKPQYRAVTESEIPAYLDAARYAAELGISGIGLDAFSMLQEKSPQVAMKVIAAIRRDEQAKDLILACEGWPFPGDAQPYLQQQMISLDMLRDGPSVSESAFAKFFERVNMTREKANVPGRVGVWMLHGSKWSDAEIAKAYSLIRQHSMIPMDWRLDSPTKFWAGGAPR